MREPSEACFSSHLFIILLRDGVFYYASICLFRTWNLIAWNLRPISFAFAGIFILWVIISLRISSDRSMSSEPSTPLKGTNDIRQHWHRRQLSGTYHHLWTFSSIEWHRERAVLSQAIPIFQCVGMGPQENHGILGRKHGLRGALVLAPRFKGRSHCGSGGTRTGEESGKREICGVSAAIHSDGCVDWDQVMPIGL